jgi:F-type H+-transporting ATPase subunit c
MMNKRNLLAALAAVTYSSAAFAQEHAATVTGDSAGHVGIAVGLAIGLAAMGGGLGQGKAIAAAMDGIARNPAVYGKMFAAIMVCLAMIESLVIFSLYICLQLLGKF